MVLTRRTAKASANFQDFEYRQNGSIARASLTSEELGPPRESKLDRSDPTPAKASSKQTAKRKRVQEDTPVVSVKVVEKAAIQNHPGRKKKNQNKSQQDPLNGDKGIKGKQQAEDEAEKPPRVKVKKAKKLLKSLHTEDSLPAVRAKAGRIYDQLMAQYIEPPCPLDHANPFQLLCSVILSAQSTDKKVNEIVPPLYKIAPDAASMAKLDVKVIENHIRQIGLAPTKAKNIKQMSVTLVEKHDGEVPDNFPDLEALAGVGHKTASVVLAVAFKRATFPVDTHIFRLGLRWGLTAGPTVEQAEADLKECWPEEQWNALHLRLIYFGREVCGAQRHDPTQCSICSWAAVPPYNVLGYSPARAGRPKVPH